MNIAHNDKRRGGSAINGYTSSKKGYKMILKIRKRVEKPSGWSKEIRLIRQIKQHGLVKANHLFQLTMIGWNLI